MTRQCLPPSRDESIRASCVAARTSSPAASSAAGLPPRFPDLGPLAFRFDCRADEAGRVCRDEPHLRAPGDQSARNREWAPARAAVVRDIAALLAERNDWRGLRGSIASPVSGSGGVSRFHERPPFLLLKNRGSRVSKSLPKPYTRVSRASSRWKSTLPRSEIGTQCSPASRDSISPRNGGSRARCPGARIRGNDPVRRQ
jgi:hypothetical protein